MSNALLSGMIPIIFDDIDSRVLQCEPYDEQEKDRADLANRMRQSLDSGYIPCVPAKQLAIHLFPCACPCGGNLEYEVANAWRHCEQCGFIIGKHGSVVRIPEGWMVKDLSADDRQRIMQSFVSEFTGLGPSSPDFKLPFEPCEQVVSSTFTRATNRKGETDESDTPTDHSSAASTNSTATDERAL